MHLWKSTPSSERPLMKNTQVTVQRRKATKNLHQLKGTSSTRRDSALLTLNNHLQLKVQTYLHIDDHKPNHRAEKIFTTSILSCTFSSTLPSKSKEPFSLLFIPTLLPNYICKTMECT